MVRAYVTKRTNTLVWLALDQGSQEIVGAYVGRRSYQGALMFMAVDPAVYRQCAVTYTDFWSAYQQVLPNSRHRVVSKNRGKTNHIERLNCTLRQRISRLVRETLSFSKKERKPYRGYLVFHPLLQ